MYRSGVRRNCFWNQIQLVLDLLLSSTSTSSQHLESECQQSIFWVWASNWSLWNVLDMVRRANMSGLHGNTNHRDYIASCWSWKFLNSVLPIRQCVRKSFSVTWFLYFTGLKCFQAHMQRGQRRSTCERLYKSNTREIWSWSSNDIHSFLPRQQWIREKIRYTIRLLNVSRVNGFQREVISRKYQLHFHASCVGWRLYT